MVSELLDKNRTCSAMSGFVYDNDNFEIGIWSNIPIADACFNCQMNIDIQVHTLIIYLLKPNLYLYK